MPPHTNAMKMSRAQTLILTKYFNRTGGLERKIKLNIKKLMKNKKKSTTQKGQLTGFGFCLPSDSNKVAANHTK